MPLFTMRIDAPTVQPPLTHRHRMVVPTTDGSAHAGARQRREQLWGVEHMRLTLEREVCAGDGGGVGRGRTQPQSAVL
jgi:hypothetical protein